MGATIGSRGNGVEGGNSTYSYEQNQNTQNGQNNQSNQNGQNSSNPYPLNQINNNHNQNNNSNHSNQNNPNNPSNPSSSGSKSYRDSESRAKKEEARALSDSVGRKNQNNFKALNSSRFDVKVRS